MRETLPVPRCVSIRAHGGQAEIGVRCGERSSPIRSCSAHALRATRGLAGLGVGAGDRVALLLRNSIEFLEASIATVPLGASAVPINWHWRGEEIAHVLSDSGAKVLVLHADLWPAIAGSVPDGVAVVVVRRGRPARGPPGALAAGASGWSAGRPGSSRPKPRPVSIIYTSGTTGKPKGVVRTPSTDEQREATQAMLGEIFQLGEGERTVIPAPMYHTAPNVYALASALRGMDMTIMKSFDAEEFLRIVAGAPRDRRADGAHDVRPHARPAERGARALRPLLAALGRPRRRALPAGGQAADDRVAGADRRRVLRLHRDGAGRLLHQRGVAGPPGHGRAADRARPGEGLRRRGRRAAGRASRARSSSGWTSGPTSPTPATRRSAARSSATAWSAAATSATSTRTASSISTTAARTWSSAAA